MYSNLSPEQLENRLKDAKALLSEVFENCLIVVPHGEGIWIGYTDRTWAFGATDRAYAALRIQEEVQTSTSSDKSSDKNEE